MPTGSRLRLKRRRDFLNCGFGIHLQPGNEILFCDPDRFADLGITQGWPTTDTALEDVIDHRPADLEPIL